MDGGHDEGGAEHNVQMRREDTDEIKTNSATVEKEIERIQKMFVPVKVEIEKMEAALAGNQKLAGEYFQQVHHNESSRSSLIRRISEFSTEAKELMSQVTELRKVKNRLLAKELNQKRLRTDEDKGVSIGFQGRSGKVQFYVIKATIEEKPSTLHKCVFRYDLWEKLEMLRKKDESFCVFGTCNRINRTTAIDFMVDSHSHCIAIMRTISKLVEMQHYRFVTTVEDVEKEMDNGLIIRHVSVENLNSSMIWSYSRQADSPVRHVPTPMPDDFKELFRSSWREENESSSSEASSSMYLQMNE